MNNLPTMTELKKGNDFIWIQEGYAQRNIFPLETGLQYIAAMAKTVGYLSDKTIPGDDGNDTSVPIFERISDRSRFCFGFISEEEVQGIVRGQILLGDEK